MSDLVFGLMGSTSTLAPGEGRGRQVQGRTASTKCRPARRLAGEAAGRVFCNGAVRKGRLRPAFTLARARDQRSLSC